MEVLESVDHPHIVQVIEMFDDNVNLYIISEWMKGGELYEYMIKVGRLTERQAASIIKQSLLAICYMHSEGIVH